MSATSTQKVTPVPFEAQVDQSAQAGPEDLQLVMDIAPNPMLMINADGSLTMVNEHAACLFGYTRDELLAMKLDDLIPDHRHAAQDRRKKRFFDDSDTHEIGTGNGLVGRCKDGTNVPIELCLNAIQTPEGKQNLAAIFDMTQSPRAVSLIQQAPHHQLRRSILDSMPFSVIALDQECRIVTTNPATLRMLGYTRDQIVGQNVADFLHLREDLEQHAGRMSKELSMEVTADHHALIVKASHGIPDHSEWNYKRRDGESIPVHVSVTPLYDQANRLTGYLQVAYDISDRKRTEAAILRMAQQDALTGLPNRTLLMQRLKTAIRQASQGRETVGVLLIDLDHFKRVNDSLGHHVGDQLLIATARRLQDQLREGDTLARLGGDEFVIVMPEVESRESMQNAVERIISQIAGPLVIDKQELVITPSVGGAIYPSDGKDAQTLIQHADAAMYAAKAKGRNNIQWFTKAMLHQNQEKLRLSSALKPALETDQFKLVYQPEVCLRTGRIIGLEALIRWRHPTLGEVPPDQFIPLAEESGMILPIGEWALRKACQEITQLNRDLEHPLEVAVNVSPRQLQNLDWLIQIMQVLKESNLHGSGLELEITEGMLIQNPTESAELLTEVRKMGVGVAIDDFGTGYSSLSYLTRFPIDKLKIDRSFIRDITVDANDAAVVDAIIAMSHSLGITVAAEGVETYEQLHYLHQRHCNLAQGYYFSPAVSAREVPGTLRRISHQLAEIRYLSSRFPNKRTSAR